MFDSLLQNNGITLERLRHFCEIAEACSISEAVEQNGRSQPTYSRSLTELETNIGSPLFEKTDTGRSGRLMGSLTPRGHMLRDASIEFFESLGRVIEYTDSPASLSIGAGETLLQWLVAVSLPAIREQFPGLQIRLHNQDTTATLHAINTARLDIGLVDSASLAETSLSDLQAISLGSITYALYLSPDYWTPTHSPRHILEHLPLTTLADMEQRLATKALSAGLKLNLEVILTGAPQIAPALNPGNLAALIPTLAEADMTAAGFHRLNLPGLPNLQIPISLVWNQRVATFRPFLAESVTKLRTLFHPML